MKTPTDAPVPASIRRHGAKLRALALRYPECREDHPWGESAFKVKGKVFLFMYEGADRLSVSVKLPDSSQAALQFPFAAPTGYGLGKSGWVSCRFALRETPPFEILAAWIAESFAAVAPKKLLALKPSPTAPAPKKATAKKATAKKATAKKATAKKATAKKSVRKPSGGR